jgi:hypothetical protein
MWLSDCLLWFQNSRWDLISDGRAQQGRLNEVEDPWFEPRASSCWRTCVKVLTSVGGNLTSVSRCWSCRLWTATLPYGSCWPGPAGECTCPEGRGMKKHNCCRLVSKALTLTLVTQEGGRMVRRWRPGTSLLQVKYTELKCSCASCVRVNTFTCCCVLPGYSCA